MTIFARPAVEARTLSRVGGRQPKFSEILISEGRCLFCCIYYAAVALCACAQLPM